MTLKTNTKFLTHSFNILRSIRVVRFEPQASDKILHLTARE